MSGVVRSKAHKSAGNFHPGDCTCGICVIWRVSGDSMIEAFASDLPAREADELRASYQRALESEHKGK